MKNVFKAVLAVLMVVAAGCSITVHQRDPKTITAVERTIENRKRDFTAWGVLVTATATPEQITGFKLANESELDRLEGLLIYEQSKHEAPK